MPHRATGAASGGARPIATIQLGLAAQLESAAALRTHCGPTDASLSVARWARDCNQVACQFQAAFLLSLESGSRQCADGRLASRQQAGATSPRLCGWARPTSRPLRTRAHGIQPGRSAMHQDHRGWERPIAAQVQGQFCCRGGKSLGGQIGRSGGNTRLVPLSNTIGAVTGPPPPAKTPPRVVADREGRQDRSEPTGRWKAGDAHQAKADSPARDKSRDHQTSASTPAGAPSHLADGQQQGSTGMGGAGRQNEITL